MKRKTVARLCCPTDPDWRGLLRCPACKHVAIDDAWDVMGLNEDERQCLQCGEIVKPQAVVMWDQGVLPGL